MSNGRRDQATSVSDGEIRAAMLSDPVIVARIERILAGIERGDSSDRAMSEAELRALLRDPN